MQIRTEDHHDQAGVHAVNAATFETDDEANLVDSLREQASPIVSLVAEDEGHGENNIVGHIMFSPVSLAGHPHPGHWSLHGRSGTVS